MPAYDYRCRVCETRFEVRRSLSDEEAPAPACPDGHIDTSRVFTAVAVGGRSSEPAAAGGCCGGGCCG